MKGIFLDRFDNKEDVESSFSVSLKEHENILFAQYLDESYSGRAWVIYYDSVAEKLYEVHGSHCSCYGLEDQFDPELTSKLDLLARIARGAQSEYDTSSVIKALEALDNQLVVLMDFDFDNLPTPQQIKNSVDIDKLIENKNIIVNQDIVIKDLQLKIVSAIKSGASEQLPSVDVKKELELTKIAKNISENNPDIILDAMKKIFQPTFDKLKDKGWQMNLGISLDSCQLDITMPFTTKKSKQSGYKF